MSKNQKYKVGDKVFAKVKGYPPWPAIVVKEGSKKYSVRFYSTGEMGFIKPEDMFLYVKFKDRYSKASKKKEFNDALIEIEKAIESDGVLGGGHADDTNNVNGDQTAMTVEDVQNKNLKRKRSTSSSDKSTDEPNNKIPYNNDELSNSGFDNETSLVDIRKVDVVVEDLEDRTNGSMDGGHAIVNGDDHGYTNDAQNNTQNEISPIFNLIFEENLFANLIYMEHVEKDPVKYKNRPVEPRPYNANEVFPIKTSNNTFVALKLHKTWPLAPFENEYEAATYDKEVADRLLQQRPLVKNGTMNVDTHPELFATKFNLNESEISGEFEIKKINKKYKIIERLRAEANLVDLDSKIKNSLTLAGADTEKALQCLDEMLNIKIDELMLKKHFHVVHMIRRLRKYVGNLEDWNLDEKATEKFLQDAKKIRDKAEIVLTKIKSVVKMPSNSLTFFDAFDRMIEEFNKKCETLSNEEVFVLCAEPDTRQAILDLQDQKLYIEHHNDLKLSDMEKENQSINSSDNN